MNKKNNLIDLRQWKISKTPQNSSDNAEPSENFSESIPTSPQQITKKIDTNECRLFGMLIW